MSPESGVSLTPIEERIRLFLIDRAKRTTRISPFDARVTYADLCASVDPEQHYWKWPRFRGIGKAIAHISTYEHQFGRPLLSALVVQERTNRAGDGFAELCRDLGHRIQPDQERVFWRGQVEAVVRYWRSTSTEGTAEDDPSAEARSLISSAMRQLAEASRLLEE
jgi:hypothetical protein